MVAVAHAEAPPRRKSVPASPPSPPPPTVAAGSLRALIAEFDDNALQFRREVAGMLQFIEHADEHVEPSWQVPLLLFLPIARRFDNYAQLFEEISSQLSEQAQK
jgi:hypothetical protein